MSQTASPEPICWQPFTPSGVARFAGASLARLLTVQVITAVFVSVCFIWFLANYYSPVILAAIQRLPEEGKISRQQLQGIPPGVLAENRFLSITVETGETRSSGVGDLQLRFGPSAVKVCSVLGCMELNYPSGWIISLSRSSLEPRWGAWKPIVLVATGLLLTIKLLLAWWALALVYMWVSRLVAFYTDRQATGAGHWKLACATQLPGAWLIGMALVPYGLGALDIVSFLIIYAIHPPVSWLYLLISPLFLPRSGGQKGKKKNPFKPTG